MIAVRNAVLLLCAALLALAGGCGPQRAKVVPAAGVVLIDGKPLTCGFVRVVPAGHRAASGKVDEQGRFRLTTFAEGDGCVQGTHPVEIIAKESAGRAMIRWLVPQKYQETSTSGLSITVDQPTEELKLELTWAGGKPWIEKTETSGDFDPTKLDVKQ